MLTHNLATRAGLTDVDSQLGEKFESVDSIEFDAYCKFLAGSLFQRLVDGSGVGSVRLDALEGVDEVCWFICAKTYCVNQERLLKSVTETTHYNTIAVFN